MADEEVDLSRRLTQVREREARKTAFRRRVWIERAILLPVLALVAVAGFNLRTGEVVGRSMQPKFHDGEKFLIFKNYRFLLPLQIGDVVVVKRKRDNERPDTEIVKRVVFIQNASGNAPLPEVMELSSGKYRFSEAFPNIAANQLTVAPNGILVMGDNVDNSTDSRVFGEVFPYEVVGKVIFH